MSNVTYNIDHYLCSDKGLLLPAINEYTWNTYIRAVLYLVAMLWCFFGVALVSEAFMCSIDHITSKTIYLPGPHGDGFNLVEVKVWNETVANLTLLAFGTSAPEILLNVIETCGHSFQAGELGPGTIVGSAAFNMFFITAFAVGCIPAGETRRVKHLGVFAVTSIFGIWAYVWLILVVLVITPKVVEIWEAVLTLLMFPLLIVFSYLADVGFVCANKRVGVTADLEIGLDLDKNEKIDSTEFLELARKLAKELGMNEDDVAKTMATHISKKHRKSSIWYRVQATRLITGGAKLEQPRSSVEDANLKMLQEIVAEPRRLPVGATESKDGGKDLRLSASSEQNLLHLKKSMVEFTAATCTVLENEGQVRVGIRRHGDLSKTITIGVETIDGTAEAGGDYIAMKQLLTFEPGETLKYVSIEIVDDDIWEPDEFFFVKLFHHPEGSSTEEVVIGKLAINQVTIVDDDNPGHLEFSKPSFIIKESATSANLVVNRLDGADGEVIVNWRARDLKPTSKRDCVGVEGVLTFGHGETSKVITIMVNDLKGDDELSFQVELSNPTGGATLGHIDKTIVTIIKDDEFNSMLHRIANKTKANLENMKLGTTTYAGQFRAAMCVNGGNLETASVLDYVLHFITFFWKVLFAFLPPPSVGGGWPTFILSLLTVGLLTAIVNDLAAIFGCLVGMSNYITAITLVAIGTGVPDLFASKYAAVNEKWADSSIGNINGSNSINVFIGLGLPWLISSVYWKVKGKEFTHPTGAVGLSVTVFTVCAVFTVLLLVVRRYMTIFGKAELGGPKTPKYLTCLLVSVVWVVYVMVSSLQAQGFIDVF
ncbi:sodium/calcium exchanger 2-like [Physella acuta]|uniref:sodium/calcium exchanger 2-like n=1 Tax=Physella acuta TaxID=109671 RepID=UPI0027DB0CA5|nr:sodium/calcium exchanger 2-like [Physella acuta]